MSERPIIEVEGNTADSVRIHVKDTMGTTFFEAIIYKSHMIVHASKPVEVRSRNQND